MMTYTLSFTITTEADPSDLLDRLTKYAGHLATELEPHEDWHGNETPAKVDDKSIAVKVVSCR